MGLFRLPSAARNQLPAQQTARGDRRVSNETQLRAAIAAVAAAGGAADNPNLVASAGQLIIIEKDFSTPAPFVIPGACLGLRIRFDAFIMPVGQVSSLFKVETNFVVFDRPLVGAKSPTEFFTTFLEHSAGFDGFAGLTGPAFNTIRGGFVFTDRLFVDLAGSGGGNVIDGVAHTSPSASHAASIVLSTSNNRVVNCPSLDDGGGDTITVSALAAARRNVIIGNNFRGGDYTATGSGGLNVVSGNTEIGATNPGAGDDLAGGNTA